ncbi:MAG: hypothetical protein JO307_17645 [Bryobacterales bacterium]|nr:hypothetical protein [Bryobacterales bacterium]MBV9398826.1 hypothetical protein [Bryobacterales bacterium]
MQNRSSTWFLLCSALLAAVLLAYSQTFAFAWDEGFHLLAAQLIKQGRRPYLDFALAQTPLNAYWNGGWMRVFGDKWRGIQTMDALVTTSALMLAAGFLRSRWREQSGWGTVALLLAGASPLVFEFGTIGQAYAIGLLMIVLAFRLATDCVRRNRTLLAAAAGFCSAAAAGSTLLTAPAAPVLLLWLIVCSPRQARWSRIAAFAGGAAIAITPILVLVAESPQRVIFDMFRYHMFYRRSDWPGSTRHDLEIFASWVDSPRGIMFAILSASGLWFILKKSGWDHATRREFYLAGCLAAALGLYVSTAHPTFVQYYVFAIPFLAILSAVGLYAIAMRLSPARATWLAAGVSIWACMGLAKEIYDKREDQSWPRMEAVARKVDLVTAPGAPLYADEHIYFLTKRTPPPGNEYISSHKLRLPKPLSEMVHIVPQPEWDRRIMAGEFATVETCEEEDWIKKRKLTEIYKQREEVSECTVFWDRAKTLAASGPED